MTSASGALLWLAFDQAARSNAEATAFTDGSISLSYAQLRTRALAAATELRATADQHPDDAGAVVALIARDPATTLAWMFGALSTGASVAPVVATGPDCDAQLRMLRPDVTVDCAAGATRLDRAHRERPPADATALGRRFPPGMIVCTAGTTGAPKAVVHSHETLGHAVRRLQLFRLESMGSSTRVPGNAAELASDLIEAAGAPRLGLRYATTLPLATMAGLTVALQALLAGECLVAEPDLGADSLLDRLRAESVTNISLTPVLAQLVLRAAREQRVQPLDQLLLVGIGGGPVAPDLPEALEFVIGCPVAVGFGTTEAGGALTMGRISDSADLRHQTAGRPLPGVELAVDARSHELSVDCASTAVGYVTEHGILDPIDRGGWPTRDLASIRPDGALELRGRADALILRGGRNIDPVRIERALEDHPAVQRAAAFGVPNRAIAGEQDIWTVVVLERAVDESELRAHCNRVLGAAMTPRRVVAVDELPLTSDGAVRRDELPGIAGTRSPALASRT